MTVAGRRKIDSMPNINELQTPTSRLFFKPLEEFYPDSERRYSCKVLSDLDYAVLGILRCLSSAKTGQEFLQEHAERGGRNENVDLYFKSLKSQRRFENVNSLNASFAPHMGQQVPDPFVSFSELSGYHFFAADGHYQTAACFDPQVETRKGLQKIATGHFFRLNLRNHHASYIDISRPKDGKKKDHDANVINRSDIETLRYQAKTGEKVVYFWDKACIDYMTWYRLKQRGIYFATKEKSNSAMEILGENPVDYEDERNNGIISDNLVGNGNGAMLRRIVYQNPRDGKIHTYITNEMQLPAWAVALLYKHRWDIEKVFDQFKNKMEEKKSWASDPIAKKSHALFECLAHNLSLIFEVLIKEQEGLSDEVETVKNKGRQATRTNREGQRLGPKSNFINEVVQRASQRTLRYLRWLRNWLYIEAPWSHALDRLAYVWGCLD